MAANALLRQYLDAGMQFTQMTRERAEAIVRDLVEAGELRREQVGSFVDELVDRSRANVDQLLDTVRNEVREQLALVEVATKEAFGRLEDQLSVLREQIELVLAERGRPAGGGRAAVPAAGTKAAAKKAAAKKAPAKKAAAKKAGAKKAGAKKTAAKKSAAKKAARTAKKSTKKA